MDRCPDAHCNVNINYYLYIVFIMTYAAPALCYGAYCTRVMHNLSRYLESNIKDISLK